MEAENRRVIPIVMDVSRVADCQTALSVPPKRSAVSICS